MGFLSGVFQQLEKRYAPGSNIDWQGYFHTPRSATGVNVTPDSALTYSAYYACIRVISETIATLPLLLYRRKDRGKDRASELPLYGLLHDKPNPELTSVEFRETKFAHVLSWGNGYSEIEFNGAGKPTALWPLRPDCMEPYRRGGRFGELRYLYQLPNGESVDFPAWRIHHLRGLGNDGIVGYSPVRMAMEAIALGLATEEFGARFFGNGARPGILLKHPGKLSDKAMERLEKSWKADHGGLSNAHRVKILEEGLDVTTVGVPPDEAQFLETRKFQVVEMARIFRVPPHMIGDLDRATFSNIEEQSLNFVIYTLRPWLVRDEQRLTADLLNDAERKTLMIEYLVDGLLRGNIAGRYQAYQTAVTGGWMTRNEVRERENLNPEDGLDKPLMPLNMVEVGSQPAPQPTPASAPTRTRAIEDREQRGIRAAKDRQAIMNRHIRVFEDAASRLVKREVSDIRKAANKHLGKRSVGSFETWLAGFYEDLRSWMPDYFRAIMETYAETIMAAVADELDGDPVQLDDELREWIEGYLANFVEVYAVGGERQLRTLIAESEEPETEINKRLDEWQETKADKTAAEQAFEAGNALAIYGYVGAGVSYLVWRASGGACPLCQKMNGKKIRIGGSFADEGDEVTAEGVDPLPIVRKIKHGPLHRGCDCTVVAA